MKVCAAQINTTVGDFEGNASRAISGIESARTLGATVVVLPELCTTGYPPLDLLERSAFVEANLRCLDAIVKATSDITAVIGFAEPNRLGPGKPLFNAAAVVCNRVISGIHRKVLLPTYDVFDEARHFEPGPAPEVITSYGGLMLGVTICEDIWNDKAVWPRSPYRENPVERLVGGQPSLIVNVSASPYVAGKLAERLELARRISLMSGAPMVYCNLVGGNDGLIFDGESFGVSSGGHVIQVARAFEEDLLLLEVEGGEAEDADATRLQPEDRALVDALSLGLKDFCRKLGVPRVVVGISGGIDSAVVATLAVRALGPDAVIGVSMPSRYTSVRSIRDGADLAANLGMALHEVQIDPIIDAHVAQLTGVFGGRPGGLTEENLQARIRAAILMSIANRHGALVLNTGNKSELATGYCTLYGDMAGALAVIGDLTKDRVYAVAAQLNRERPAIPEDTIARPPSAELRPDQKDEDSLPPYPVLDPIVRAHVENGLDATAIIGLGLDPRTVRRVIAMIAASEFKRRQAPPALKVTARAFGIGRRFPIVQRFREDAS